MAEEKTILTETILKIFMAPPALVLFRVLVLVPPRVLDLSSATDSHAQDAKSY